MEIRSFQIVVEKEPQDEGYFAYAPILPGCSSNGRTIEETKRNMREAIQAHLKSLHTNGQETSTDNRRTSR